MSSKLTQRPVSKAPQSPTMQTSFEREFGRPARHDCDTEYNRAFNWFARGWQARKLATFQAMYDIKPPKGEI